MSKKEIDFEKALARLESIVEQLESSQLPLEDSLRLFEEGVRLSRTCSQLLDQAEKRVKELSKTQEDSPVTRDWSGDEE